MLRDDLQFSGIVDLVSPSFYPTQVPTVPSELRNLDWTTPQISNANLVAFGNLTRNPPAKSVSPAGSTTIRCQPFHASRRR